MQSRADVFQKVYDSGEWGRGSGAGSDPQAAQPYVDLVSRFIAQNAIRSVIDLGHGDWRMWPKEAFSTVDYHGVDVVPSVTDAVRDKHASPRRTFESGDILEIGLPPSDLVLCKDVLMHLPNQDVIAVLRRLLDYRFVIICHSVFRRRLRPMLGSVPLGRRVRGDLRNIPAVCARTLHPNKDITAGEVRTLDILKRPIDAERIGFSIIERFDFHGESRTRVSEAFAKRVWVLSSDRQSRPA